MGSSVMITGANRGIGLELARQYLEDGWTVVGTSRRPKRANKLRRHGEDLDGTLHVVGLDVTDRPQVEAACEQVSDHLEALDVLINNAGVLGSKAPFEELDEADVRSIFEVDCLGHFTVTRTFFPLIKRAKGNVVFVSSLMGSIEDNRSGGRYPYRIAKAGLNMLGRTLAMDYGPEGVHTLLMNPGWVKTDLGNPGAKVEVEDSASGIRRVIEQLDGETNGSFLNYKGEEEPW